MEPEKKHPSKGASQTAGEIMKTKKEYNGWHNRATWNLWLWAGNLETVYHGSCEFATGTKGRITGAMAESFFRGIFVTGKTADGDSLDDVHWPEIARALMELRE